MVKSVGVCVSWVVCACGWWVYGMCVLCMCGVSACCVVRVVYCRCCVCVRARDYYSRASSVSDWHTASPHPHLCPPRQLFFFFLQIWENWESERIDTVSIKVANVDQWNHLVKQLNPAGPGIPATAIVREVENPRSSLSLLPLPYGLGSLYKPLCPSLFFPCLHWQPP